MELFNIIYYTYPILQREREFIECPVEKTIKNEVSASGINIQAAHQGYHLAPTGRAPNRIVIRPTNKI